MDRGWLTDSLLTVLERHCMLEEVLIIWIVIVSHWVWEVWTFPVYKKVCLGPVGTERVWCMPLFNSHMILWYRIIGFSSLSIDISFTSFWRNITHLAIPLVGLCNFFISFQFFLRSKLLGNESSYFKISRDLVIWRFCVYPSSNRHS